MRRYLCVMLLCLLTLGPIMGCNQRPDDGINMPAEVRSLVGENYRDVIDLLAAADFTHVSTDESNDFVAEWQTEDGTAEENEADEAMTDVTAENRSLPEERIGVEDHTLSSEKDKSIDQSIAESADTVHSQKDFEAAKAPETTKASETGIPPEFTSDFMTVRRNEVVTITVKGNPNTEYTISVKYKSGHESKANGLGKAMSDADGNVSWTWRIGSRTGLGKATFTVSDGVNHETYHFEVIASD